MILAAILSCTLLKAQDNHKPLWLIKCGYPEHMVYINIGQKIRHKRRAISEAKEWLELHDSRRYVVAVQDLRK